MTATTPMTPERVAVLYRIVHAQKAGDYAGRAEDIKYALEHKAEFRQASSIEGFVAVNGIEVMG